MNPAIVNILISGVFFAILNVLVRWCDDYSIYQIIFFRALVTAVISYGMIRKKNLDPFGNDRRHLVLRGLFGFLGLSFYFLTLQNMPLATAVSIQYLSPVFTAVLAIVLNRQPLPWYTWLFYLLALLGVWFIKGVDSRVSTIMVLAGVASAFFSGFAYNMIRRIGKKDDPDVIVFYFPLVTLPLVVIPACMNWVWPDFTGWLLLLGVGVSTQFGQVYMTRAYQHSELSGVAIFQYFGLVYAISLGWLFFEETYSWLTYVGMFLVVAGAVANTLVVNYRTRKVLGSDKNIQAGR